MIATASDNFAAMRHAMIVSQLRTTGVDEPRLIDAVSQVAREDFVAEGQRQVAYADIRQPLGEGRALNTPMVTARLLNAATIHPGNRVLIVGAATGYAAAIAVAMGAKVTAVESDAALAARARAAVPGAKIVTGPMEKGARADGPFDAIVIDGAVEHVPETLVAQLSKRGRIAGAIIDRGVTRLALGSAGGSGFAMVPFADADAVPLPGFARPKSFVF